jgi:hypothetical protein
MINEKKYKTKRLIYNGYEYVRAKDKERATIPTSSTNTINFSKLLRVIDYLQETYKDIKNIEIQNIYIPAKGHGEDRDSDYYTYNILFDTLETDIEYKQRIEQEERNQKKQKEQEEKVQAEEKKKLKELIKKYGIPEKNKE